MSYGITPIAVSLAKVESHIGPPKGGFFSRLLGGSPDKLLQEIKRRSDYRFEQDDLIDDDEPTLEKALEDLLKGNALDPTFGFKYAYAFELVCDRFGEGLNNSQWSAMRGEWAEEVQQAMEKAGVDPSVINVHDHLFYRGAPIEIPKPGDFPFIGYLRADEIPTAAQAIDRGDLTKVEDEEVEAAIAQIREWLERCQELGCDLVCFYY